MPTDSPLSDRLTFRRKSHFVPSLLALEKNRGRDNNLNAIRLVLALAVLWGHCAPLTLGYEVGAHRRIQNVAAYYAVDLFFFLSGFLITASWLHSKSLGDYLRRRILRIHPGFFVALVFSIGAETLANPRGLLHKTLSLDQLRVALADGVRLSAFHLTGPLIFPNNPYPHVSNGSMWTIPMEFFCYLAVAALGMVYLFKRRRLILFGTVILYILNCRMAMGGESVSLHDRRFLLLFFLGTNAWLWRDKIPMHGGIAWLAAVLGVGEFAFVNLPPLLTPLMILIHLFSWPYLLLWLGYAGTNPVTRWCESTDISYGVYLYAFPIRQLIATAAWGRNPSIMFITAAPLTLLAGLASWHLVEKWFLRLKNFQGVDFDPALRRPDAEPDEVPVATGAF